MEKFRGFSYSNMADSTYVNTNIIQSATTSEAVLPNFTETVTVSGYLGRGGSLGGRFGQERLEPNLDQQQSDKHKFHFGDELRSHQGGY